jgi:hypothetical protein
LTDILKHAHPVVCTPAIGIDHLSHLTPLGSAPDGTVVNDPFGGNATGDVEYDTAIVIPSVDPQSIAVTLSGTYVVPSGTASVTTNEKALADE